MAVRLRSSLHPLHITPPCNLKPYVTKTMTGVLERERHPLDIISVMPSVKCRDVFKYNIAGGEAMARDERERDGARNAFVAGCNAPQTNSAVLSPGGVERAFKFMLTLQEAAAVATSN